MPCRDINADLHTLIRRATSPHETRSTASISRANRAGSTSRIRRSWHRHTVKKITAYLVFRIAEGACWDRGVAGKPLDRGIKIVVGTLKDLGGKNVDGR